MSIGPLPKTTRRRGSQIQSISVWLAAFFWSSCFQRCMLKKKNSTVWHKTHLTVKGPNGFNGHRPCVAPYLVLKRGLVFLLKFEAFHEWANQSQADEDSQTMWVEHTWKATSWIPKLFHKPFFQRRRASCWYFVERFHLFYLNCTNKTTAFKLQANETAITEHLGHINDMWHSRRMETKHTSLQMSAESTACGGHSFVL